MQINRRSLDVLVAEQFLDGVEVHVAFQRLRGKGMAKFMGVDVDSSLFLQLIEQVLEAVFGKAHITIERGKERHRGFVELPALLQIILQNVFESLSQGNNAVTTGFGVLASHGDGVFLKVDVREFQAEQFVAPHAGHQKGGE